MRGASRHGLLGIVEPGTEAEPLLQHGGHGGHPGAAADEQHIVEPVNAGLAGRLQGPLGDVPSPGQQLSREALEFGPRDFGPADIAAEAQREPA